jgi:DNA invertase Pin-like site-specific DNA recombinase
MKAIGYVRVSTEEQATEGVSVAAQEERIRAYCTMRGIELVGIVQDLGVSAGKPLASRPGGRRLLEEVRRRGGARAVVAWKLDRLFRDVVDCLTNASTWDRRGVNLHLIDLGGQAIDTASAMGRMFLTMMAAIGEWERNVIGERTRAALQHKKAQGEFVGTAPFGYRREGDLVVEDPEEQKTIAEVVSMAQAGMSRRAITEELNRERQQYRPRGRRWHLNTVARILVAEKAGSDISGIDTIV